MLLGDYRNNRNHTEVVSETVYPATPSPHIDRLSKRSSAADD